MEKVVIVGTGPAGSHPPAGRVRAEGVRGPGPQRAAVRLDHRSETPPGDSLSGYHGDARHPRFP